MTIREIQKALANHGYPTGPIDGIWGRQTVAALKAFQRDNHLEVDGIVGPQTIARMFAHAPATATPFADGTLPWFQEAKRLVGVREAPGAQSNATILDWAGNLDIHYKDDATAWCGLFVAHCIGATLTDESLPANPLGARQWAQFGVSCEPTTGSILVFWREARNSYKGHVGFYAGEDATAYRVLGGNQADSVSLAWIAKERLLDSRWPKSVAVRTSGPVLVSRTEPFSVNEG